MRLTIAQLEAFYWIAKLGSVKEAAEQLHLAQPTISLRVDDLEAELGIPLFEKVGRGLTLTHRGEALLPRASAIFEELARIRETAGSAEQLGGILRIGSSETFAQACLPAFVLKLNVTYPSLLLDIAVRTSAELEEDILERKLDIAFAVNPIGNPRLAVVSLGIQGVTWAASPRLGLPSTIRPAHLQDTIVVTNPHPSPMYRQIIDWFRESGLEPTKVWKCSSVRVAAQLAAGGLGASLLPRKMIENEVAEGALVPLATERDVQPSRLFAIYRFADKSALIEGVIELSRQTIDELAFVD